MTLTEIAYWTGGGIIAVVALVAFIVSTLLRRKKPQRRYDLPWLVDRDGRVSTDKDRRKVVLRGRE